MVCVILGPVARERHGTHTAMGSKHNTYPGFSEVPFRTEQAACYEIGGSGIETAHNIIQDYHWKSRVNGPGESLSIVSSVFLFLHQGNQGALPLAVSAHRLKMRRSFQLSSGHPPT